MSGESTAPRCRVKLGGACSSTDDGVSPAKTASTRDPACLWFRCGVLRYQTEAPDVAASFDQMRGRLQLRSASCCAFLHPRPPQVQFPVVFLGRHAQDSGFRVIMCY